MTTFNDLLRALDREDAGLRFVDGDDVYISYADLGRLIQGNARHFLASGVKAADLVAMHFHSDLEHVVTALALMAIGAVPMSLKPPRAGESVPWARIAERFGVSACAGNIAPPTGLPRLLWNPGARWLDAASVERVSPEHIAFVQFSSGSTGVPKAVPIRHESLVHNTRAIARSDARSSASVGGCVVPLCHDMGWLGLLSCLEWQNAGNVCTTSRFLRRPFAFLSSMSRCDTIAMPDFMLRYLSRALKTFRKRVPAGLLARFGTIFCGAEPIRRETVANLITAGRPHGFDPSSLVFAYGLAEATLIVTARRFDGLEQAFVERGGRALARLGAPVHGMEVAARGTIRLRGPSVMRGYLDGPDLDGGWHDTNDVGAFQDGDLLVMGRADDVIIVNGENFFPGDIEAAVTGLPGVRDCVAVSEGEAFGLFVVAGAGYTEPAVVQRLVERFGAAPSRVIAAAAGDIPRTTSGKPRRRELRSRLGSTAA